MLKKVQKLFELLQNSFPAEIFYIFIATRASVLLLALFFTGLVISNNNITPAEMFSQWDGQWYLKLASEGYHWQGPDVQANVAFFPLYPALAKILTTVTGNLELSFLIISHLALFIFLIFLYKLVRIYADKETALRTVWYISIFPLSFVFSIVYTESLFLMLTAGALYFASRRNWNLAVIFSLFSCLTRLAGLVILPTLLYYYYESDKKYLLSIWLKILSISTGLILFSLYLQYKVGDFLAYIHVLKAWRILYQNPILTVMSTLKIMSQLPKNNYYTALGVFDLSLFVIFLIILILSYKRLPKTLFIYSFLIFLLNIFKSWDPSFFYPIGSVNRYLMEAFPLFYVLAKLGKNKFFDVTYTTLSLTFLGLLSLSFFTGKWVF